PADSNRSLSDAQKDLLDRWILQGAPYDTHWSFKPPIANETPALRSDLQSWPKNGIDRFIAARFLSEGLEPSPAADRETLARRASLTLTGLPPTPKQLDAFLSDETPEAWNTYLDQLLDSIDYAERQALRWLDAARFADTDGYQNDAERSNWPWRDWVIQSFHENQPFDQFTIEQLAGDMLPDPTPEQILATAFNRNHRQNSEGGALAEEFLVENIIDRVETTATVWLGLTMGCSRCHDHKYDPLSQREFYQFFAYFNNIGESGIGKGTGANPVVQASSPIAKAPAELTEKVETARKAVVEAETTIAARLDAWIARATAELKSDSEADWLDAEIRNAVVKPTGTLLAEKDGSWRLDGENPANATYEIEIALPADKRITGIRLDALPHDSFGKPRKLARSSNGNFVLTGLTATRGDSLPLGFRQAIATFSQDNFPVTNVIDADPKSGWAIFGKKSESGQVSALFLLDQPIQTSAKETLTLHLAHEGAYGGHNIGRLRLYLTDQENPNLDGKSGLDTNLQEALKSPAEKRTPDQRKALREHYTTIDPELTRAKKELAKIEKQMSDQGYGSVSVMVMREKDGDPAPSYLLNRGQYIDPDTSAALPRAVPAALFSGKPENQPRDRLELAQWLVSAENPLTARVVVNRVWQEHFGTGLVKTAEDFGSQGEVPSHPELLDWLAVKFRESGWDLKALHRLILSSATWQQGSVTNPPLLSQDPQNRFLARGPRFRLDGFTIRDSALQAAGLLSTKVGGPPVKPYQPEGLWNAVNQSANFRYSPSSGSDLYRKSLYTYWKRAVNPPRQIIFDAGGREVCNVSARRTNTPLQALVLMNDTTFLEAARNLAQRVIKDESSEASRLGELYRLATARKIDDETSTVLGENLAFFRAHFTAAPEAAAAFLSSGESPTDESVSAPELAAWASVAHLVLNLDETISLE
ncbi:MAG: DUF1553 domain-containing protein, partial [Verrucomicrobiae bacterium]|nr:DUF1553 domain-containing protein [Verrucomicrobiae bacterium]